MLRPRPSNPLCTFRILLKWSDSGATEVRQWRDSGAPTGPTHKHFPPPPPPSAPLPPPPASPHQASCEPMHQFPSTLLGLLKENGRQNTRVSLMNRGSKARWGTADSVASSGSNKGKDVKPALSKNMPCMSEAQQQWGNQDEGENDEYGTDG